MRLFIYEISFRRLTVLTVIFLKNCAYLRHICIKFWHSRLNLTGTITRPVKHFLTFQKNLKAIIGKLHDFSHDSTWKMLVQNIKSPPRFIFPVIYFDLPIFNQCSTCIPHVFRGCRSGPLVANTLSIIVTLMFAVLYLQFIYYNLYL